MLRSTCFVGLIILFAAGYAFTTSPQEEKKLDLEAEKMYAATVDVPSLQIETLKLVDTNDPEKSYLLMKIRGDEGIVHNRMPLNAAPLGSDDIKTIRLWIHALNILNTN
jgi:hypothetical protein